MRWCEGLANQICEPILQLDVTRHDEANIISVKGIPDAKADITATAVTGQVWGF